MLLFTSIKNHNSIVCDGTMRSVFITAFTWFLLHLILNYFNKHRSQEWNCRILALVHALLVTEMIGIYTMLYHWPLDHLGERNTPMQRIVMIISTGYFMFDTSWCLYMKTETLLMIIHHFTSLIFLICSLWIDRSGAETICVIWGSELTNPFLQVRWFLKKEGFYDTKFAKLNDLVFVIFFTTVRVMVGGYLMVATCASKQTLLLVKIGGFIFYIIGVVWLYQILIFAAKRFAFSGTCKSQKNDKS